MPLSNTQRDTDCEVSRDLKSCASGERKRLNRLSSFSYKAVMHNLLEFPLCVIHFMIDSLSILNYGDDKIVRWERGRINE